MFNLLGTPYNPYGEELTSLLGLDPAEMRKQALWRGIAGAGANLASSRNIGDIGRGFMDGVNSAQDGFLQNALLGYRIKNEAADREWEQQDREYKLSEREQQAAAEKAQTDALNNFLSNPSQSAFAQAFPEEYAKQYGKSLFPDPQQANAVKSYAPIPYDMGDGQIGYGIPMEDGSFRPVQTPDGAQFLSPYDKAYQSSAGKTRGQTETEQALTAPADVSAADQALGILDQIVASPYLDRGTGFWSYGNMVPGTGGYDFQNLVDQAKSGAFLTAIQQMKGLGALSNMEGQAATAAVTRINTATSKEAFLKAVADYRAIIETAKARAQSRIGANQTQPIQQPNGGYEEWGVDANGNPMRLR